MHYTVISDYNHDQLDKRVTERLKEGWQLQGGVSVCPIDDPEYKRGTLLYSQAMFLP